MASSSKVAWGAQETAKDTGGFFFQDDGASSTPRNDALGALPDIGWNAKKVDAKQLQADLKKMMDMSKDVAELRARAKEVVAQFDADNSGSFDRKEISKCLRSMGMELSDKEMRAYTKSLFKKLDMDG